MIVRNLDYSTMHPEPEDVLLLVEGAGPTMSMTAALKCRFARGSTFPKSGLSTSNASASRYTGSLIWTKGITSACLREPPVHLPSKHIRTERRDIRIAADALTELTPTLNALAFLYFSPLVFELGVQSFNVNTRSSGRHTLAPLSP